jgi:hypothetical protein
MVEKIFLFLYSFSFPLLLSAQLDSSHLPIVIINTNGQTILDEPKIMADMGIIDNGPNQINHISDPYNGYDGKIGIELRGSTSQFLYEKKQYAVETRDLFGDNVNISLLGLPTENDWILHGPFSDKTLIRNALAYKLAGKVMNYAPRFKFCEVVINGDYKGLYLLLEKIKRDNDRVDIARLNPEDNEDDQLTGGYILKINKFDGGINDGFMSRYEPRVGGNQQIFFQYHYPKPEDITAQQSDYIKGFIDEFEEVMFGNNFNDPINGYSKYIDVKTFIDYLLINELAKNVDAYRISTFLYKDKESVDGRLKMGPVWDFNLGFGNVDFCMGPNPEDWVLDYMNFCPDDFWLRPFWWTKLLQDTTFRKLTKERWVELRSNILSNDNIQLCIDSLVNEIGIARERNFDRWPVLGEYVWPNAFVGGNYKANLAYMEEWLFQRLLWLDGEINDFDEIPYDSQQYFDPIVYPNPGAGLITFEYYARQSHDVSIIIYNALGQVVQILEDLEHPNGLNKLTWEPPPFFDGLFFYTVYFNDKRMKTGTILCNK